MSIADLEVNRSVRRVFVRHWIDLGRISLRTIQGALSIRGTLQRIPGMDTELASANVEVIFNEIRRIKTIKRVRIDLDNWTDKDGRWVLINSGKANKNNPKISATPSATKSFNIDSSNSD